MEWFMLQQQRKQKQEQQGKVTNQSFYAMERGQVERRVNVPVYKADTSKIQDRSNK